MGIFQHYIYDRYKICYDVGTDCILKCEILNHGGNYVALIPSDQNTKYCQNTAVIYNTHLEKIEAEVISETIVKSV